MDVKTKQWMGNFEICAKSFHVKKVAVLLHAFKHLLKITQSPFESTLSQLVRQFLSPKQNQKRRIESHFWNKGTIHVRSMHQQSRPLRIPQVLGGKALALLVATRWDDGAPN